MSETFGPLDHYPGILERARGLIDCVVQLRDRPGVTGIRLWGATHPHHLYGERTNAGMAGATPAAAEANRILLGRARRGELVRSASFRRHRYDESMKDLCRFIINLEDFAGPPSPSDDRVVYAAIQQERATLPEVTVDGFTGRVNRVKGALDTNDPIMGPILVVPTADQWTLRELVLVIRGTAPQLGGGAAAMTLGDTPTPHPDLQIPNPLHLVLPRPTTSMSIRNLEAAPGTGLLVSYGLGQTVYEIAAGNLRETFGSFGSGTIKEVCLMANAAAAVADFEITVTLSLGPA